jgi:hypothetical protein
MVTIYAPLIGVPRTEWLMYMRPLELQGLHGYYVCILWDSKDLINIMYASFGALRGMMS